MKKRVSFYSLSSMAAFLTPAIPAFSGATDINRPCYMHKVKKLLAEFWMIVIVVSLITGCSNLNKRIDQKIESVGSELTGVPVDVDTVNLKIIQGSGQITGLTVANPEGYSAENAFEMDLMRLNLGIFSILTGSHPLILDELVIDAPVVNLEMNKQDGSNLEEIRKNVEENLEKADRKSQEKKPASDEPPDEPRRIAVSRLVIEGANFNVRRIDGSTHSGTLPDIELTDVGGSEGKTMGGLGTVVVVAMTKEMLKEALTRKLLEGVDGFKSQAAGAFIAEKVLGALDQRLELSGEQREKLKVVIETAVQELNKAIIEQAGLGLLDHESLSSHLGAIAEAAQVQLKDDFNDEQMEEIKAFFAKLSADVVETIREALFKRLSRFLDLTPEQIEQFQPIFREELEKWSVLLSRFVSTFKDFVNDYEALQKETHQKLEGMLNEDQMKALTERQEALRKMIRLVFSSDR